MPCSFCLLHVLVWLVAITALGFSRTPAQAEITLDGTLGPKGPLTGPNFEIPAHMGQQLGGNLFHSFGVFNINTGESATFTGSNSVQNILGRVTGGTSSTIDGVLRSTIPGANLYLINPAGILFGPNAQLEVQGSFHASTADYLRLGKDGRFDAVQPDNSLLTVAPPTAFGFLADKPAAISVQGSFLQVPKGKTLSLIGGDITLTDSTLFAPAGCINIASVASPGRVIPNVPEQVPDLKVKSFARLGKITITHSAAAPRPKSDDHELGNVDVSGQVGGTVFIRGGKLVMDNSQVLANTYEDRKGGDINIHLKQNAFIDNGGLINANTFGLGQGGNLHFQAGSLALRNGAQISTRTFGPGAGGNLEVVADSITLAGTTNALAAISALTAGSGKAGNLHLRASSLEMRDGAAISTSTFGPGQGGDLEVMADNVTLSGINAPVGILTSTAGSGHAGNLRLQTGHLEVRNGALIDASTIGSGAGGDLEVVADSITLAGTTNAPAAISAFTKGSGNAGNLHLRASSLEMRDGARINASTSGDGDAGNIDIKVGKLTLTSGAQIFNGTGSLEIRNGNSTFTGTGGPGKGGNLTITATDSISIAGRDSKGFRSGFFSNALFGTGDAGNLTISAPTLEMDDGQILASTESKSSGKAGNLQLQTGRLAMRNSAQIDASTYGPGAGGSLSLQVGSLELLDGAVIGAATLGSGPGGNLDVVADSITLTGTNAPVGILTSAAGSGHAGNLRLQTGHLEVRNGALIDASTVGSGAGGDLEVVADSITLAGITNAPAAISALTAGSGKAGNLRLQTGRLAMHGSALIDARTLGLGQGGDIHIQASEITLSQGSSISARSLSQNLSKILNENPDAGKSGGITITARDSVRLQNGSSITVETAQANAGDINLNAGHLVHLRDKSKITTSVAGGQGNGGNITIDPEFVVLDGSSAIIAQAKQGSGGNINIRITGGGALFQSPDSIIDASSEFGLDGSVAIDAPDTDISGGLVVLPESFLDVAPLLSDRCGVRRAENVSSLIVVGRGGIPPVLAGLLPSTYLDRNKPSRQDDYQSNRGRESVPGQLSLTLQPARGMFEPECGQ